MKKHIVPAALVLAAVLVLAGSGPAPTLASSNGSSNWNSASTTARLSGTTWTA